MRVVAVVVLSGCVRLASPDDPKPSRVILEASPRVGMAVIDEAAPDGATGPAATFGGHLGVMYRLHPRFAIGGGLDLAASHHDTMIEGRTAAYWWLYLPVLVTRVDLGAFALSAWTGYYLGFREITAPGCYFGTCTFGSQDLHGGGLGAAALFRLGRPDIGVEIGPYVQSHVAWSKEDDGRTPDFNEDGMRVRSLAVGVSVHAVIGSK
jgi:hypothetical protein